MFSLTQGREVDQENISSQTPTLLQLIRRAEWWHFLSSGAGAGVQTASPGSSAWRQQGRGRGEP